MFAEISDAQSANTYEPIESSPSDKKAFSNFLHDWKHDVPSTFTDAGIDTVSKLVQWKKVLSPMAVTLFGIVIFFNLRQFANVNDVILSIFSGSVTLSRFSQSRKHLTPNLSTFFGRVAEVRRLHASKQYSPISTIPSGITIDLMFEPVKFSTVCTL